jgi:phosphoglycolate phosphatase
VAKYLAGEGDCGTMPGVRETIAAIRTRGLEQIVLSASNLTQLRGQLERLGLLGEFREVIGLDNIHARSKKAQALEWMAAHPTAVPLFVGDTEHDAQVADAVGADCVLYTGGHQSERKLMACGKPIISDIRELLAFL